jgi:hypothetical protein
MSNPITALEAKLQELLAENIRSGTFDEMIRKKLVDLVDGLLSEQLRSWSPFGESVKKQLAAALNVNLSQLGLGGYNVLVAEVVRSRIEAQVKGEWAEQLKQQVDSMLRHAPAELKLSQLFEEFVEGWTEAAHSDGWAHATMHVSASEYRSTWVYIDPKPYDDDRDRYGFMWRLLIGDDGDLCEAEQYQTAARSKSVSAGAERRSLFSSHHGFEGLLFQLRAGKTKIIIDRKPGLHEFEYPEKECEC